VTAGKTAQPWDLPYRSLPAPRAGNSLPDLPPGLARPIPRPFGTKVVDPTGIRPFLDVLASDCTCELCKPNTIQAPWHPECVLGVRTGDVVEEVEEEENPLDEIIGFFEYLSARNGRVGVPKLMGARTVVLEGFPGVKGSYTWTFVDCYDLLELVAETGYALRRRTAKSKNVKYFAFDNLEDCFKETEVLILQPLGRGGGGKGKKKGEVTIQVKAPGKQKKKQKRTETSISVKVGKGAATKQRARSSQGQHGRLTLNDAARAFVMAQTKPWLPAALGARIPGKYACFTDTYHFKTTICAGLDVGSNDTSGTFVFYPDPYITMLNADILANGIGGLKVTDAGGMNVMNNGPSGLPFLYQLCGENLLSNVLENYRVVGFSVVVNCNMKEIDRTGFMVACPRYFTKSIPSWVAIQQGIASSPMFTSGGAAIALCGGTLPANIIAGAIEEEPGSMLASLTDMARFDVSFVSKPCSDSHTIFKTTLPFDNFITGSVTSGDEVVIDYSGSGVQQAGIRTDLTGMSGFAIQIKALNANASSSTPVVTFTIDLHLEGTPATSTPLGSGVQPTPEQPQSHVTSSKFIDLMAELVEKAPTISTIVSQIGQMGFQAYNKGYIKRGLMAISN